MLFRSGQVAPAHPAWVGHLQRKCPSSFPGCRPEDPAAQIRGRAPTALGRPRAQPPARAGVCRAPRDLPWPLLLTGRPGHTGPLPFSQQSFAVPSSKHVLGGPLCLGAAFCCVWPSRPEGGPGGPRARAETACCGPSWVRQLCCQRSPQVAPSSRRRPLDGGTRVSPVFTREASGPGWLDNSPKVTQGTEEAEPLWSAVAGPPPRLLASPAGVGGVLCGLGRLAGCSVGCLAALGWRVPRALDTLSAACRGPLRAVAPRGLSSQLPDPLKPCAAGWPLHPLWRGAGQLSLLSQGFPQGTAQRGDTRQIPGAPAELTVFWEMLLKPADRVGGGAGGILEAVGSSGHPSPFPLHPDSPTWLKLASWPPCSPPSSVDFSVLMDQGDCLGR